MADDFNPETATLDDMERFAAEAGSAADRLERRLDDARREYALRVERHPAVGTAGEDAVRASLDEHYRPTLLAAEAEVETAASALWSRLHAVRDLTTAVEPSLPPDQMADAANRMVFVERQCKDWPLPRLAGAVRHALVTDDKPALLCFLQALPSRLADETPDGGGFGPDPASRERAEVRRMLGVAKERLTDPRFADLNARAAAAAVRASAVGREAAKRRREEERAARPYSFQKPGDVRWETGEKVG